MRLILRIIIEEFHEVKYVVILALLEIYAKIVNIK